MQNISLPPKPKKEYEPKIQKPKTVSVKISDINNEININEINIIDINNANKEISSSQDSGKNKMRITYEDLNKEITDILNGTATKMVKKTDDADNENQINTSSNQNDEKIEYKYELKNDKNDYNELKSERSDYKYDLKNDRNEVKNDLTSIFSNNDAYSINDNSETQSNVNSLFSQPSINTSSMSLGLSVHLHKDQFRHIFKYYLHHHMKEGFAAFYCSDKRCTGSAKYTIENKKFEIASDHSIPYENHTYIAKPFPNDQRLFKEFERRNFNEAQLFKQANGRSNIFWYN